MVGANVMGLVVSYLGVWLAEAESADVVAVGIVLLVVVPMVCDVGTAACSCGYFAGCSRN